jgi:hypothetical protein
MDKAKTSCRLEVQLIALPLSMTTFLDSERRLVLSTTQSEYEKTVMVVWRCVTHEPYVKPKEYAPLR